MKSNRRSILKTGGLLAAALGSTSLAGCIDQFTGGSSGSGKPGYASWLYDPDEVMDVENQFFGSINVQDLFANQDQFPEGTFSGLDRADQQIPFVDLRATEHFTVLAYGETPGTGFGQMSRGAFGQVGGQAAGQAASKQGATMVVEGSFDAATINQRLEPRAEQLNHEEYEGYDVYTVPRSSFGGASSMGSAGNAVVAFDSGAILAGSLQGTNDDPAVTVKRAIDVHDGSATSKYDGEDATQTLVDEFGNPTFVGGANFDVTQVRNQLPSNTSGQMARQVVEGLVGSGVAGDIQGATTTVKFALVYESADAAPVDTIRDFKTTAETGARAQGRERAADLLEGLTVSQNGDAVVMETSVQTQMLFSGLEDTSGVMGTSESGSDSASASQPMRMSVSFQ